MVTKRLLIEPWEADARLGQFGVTRDELLDIVSAVAAGRADAVPGDDPASAEGLFAYIYGTRLLRRVFRSKGWLVHREDNIEFVKHPDLPIKIAYQSVDLACSLVHDPRAVSGKGAGADRLIVAGQGDLFAEEALTAASEARRLAELRGGVWFFCVSVVGDDVRAELSLPSALDGSNFGTFIERIFIVREGEWSKIDLTDKSSSDAAEFEPVVSRR